MSPNWFGHLEQGVCLVVQCWHLIRVANIMENGGFDGLNNKQKKQSAFNMLVHETSKFMTQISEELSVSPELSSAINEENVNEMR